MKSKWNLIAVLVISLLVLTTSFSGLAAAAKTKLVVAIHYGEGQIEYLTPYFEEYMSLNPDVEIEWRTIAFDDYLRQITVSHIAGEAPDIYHIYSLWSPQLVDANILAEPPKTIVDFVNKNYVVSAIDGATVNGKLFGIPTEIDNYALVYNKKLFAEAGFTEPPKTWDELVDMAVKLTKRNADGKITQHGFAFMTGWDSAVVHPFLALLFSEGGRLFADDFRECLLDSPEALRALEKEVRLFKEGATDETSSVWEFVNGTVAMMIMAPWAENTYRATFKEEFAETVGVAPIPDGAKGSKSALYSWMFAVDSGSKSKDEAWKFLKWLNSEQEATNTSRMGDFLVTLGIIPSAQYDLENHPEEMGDFFSQGFIQLLPNSIAEPNVLQGAEIKTALMEEILQAWYGKKTPEKALADAKRRIDDILFEMY